MHGHERTSKCVVLQNLIQAYFRLFPLYSEASFRNVAFRKFLEYLHFISQSLLLLSFDEVQIAMNVPR